MGGEPAFWAIPCAQLRADRRWLRVDRDRLARALRRPAAWRPCDDRPLRLGPAPAICRLHPGDAGLPRAVADATDAGDVSGADEHVRAAGEERGARGARGVWRGLCEIHDGSAGLHPAAWSPVRPSSQPIKWNEALMTAQPLRTDTWRTELRSGP